jgi:hypothetical protein
MKEQVAEWLRSLQSITVVEPITLTIGKQTWEGAVYTQGGQRRYYLVGELPKTWRKVCFRFGDSQLDWFVSGYLQDPGLITRHKQYHPFGNNWMLKAWDIPDRPESTIDDHEPIPYKRIKATVA